jgi:hypothetical protein
MCLQIVVSPDTVGEIGGSGMHSTLVNLLANLWITRVLIHQRPVVKNIARIIYDNG